MRLETLSEAKTFEEWLLPKILGDLSGKAHLWDWATRRSLSDGRKHHSSEGDLTGLDISLTGLEDSLAKSAESIWREAISHKPRTPLGQKLWEIRARILASGAPLLSLEEIEGEIAVRRGERE